RFNGFPPGCRAVWSILGRALGPGRRRRSRLFSNFFRSSLSRNIGPTARRAPSMNPSLDTLGIIAGNRSLPLVFARQARQCGVKRLVAVAFDGETDPALGDLVDEIIWVKVGQLSKMIAAFTDRGVKRSEERRVGKECRSRRAL